MNQEKIMKTKMVIAMVVALLMMISTFIFVGLYHDQKLKNRQEYIDKYEQNLKRATDEIETYNEKQTDYYLHYNMILSDLGAARTLIFLVDDYTEKQKIINELHYCFVKYPEQMSEKLDDVYIALNDIVDHLDKGYDEAEKIVDSIDKKGE